MSPASQPPTSLLSSPHQITVPPDGVPGLETRNASGVVTHATLGAPASSQAAAPAAAPAPAPAPRAAIPQQHRPYRGTKDARSFCLLLRHHLHRHSNTSPSRRPCTPESLGCISPSASLIIVPPFLFSLYESSCETNPRPCCRSPAARVRHCD